MAERRLGSAAGWSEAGAPAPPGPPGPDDRADDDAQRLALPQEERYQAGGELGAGGMGQVVSALDRRLQRQVALKRVASGLCSREGLERRLAREARITAALDHPGIVPIFDAGRAADGALYYTMRMVRGRTLGDAIAAAAGLPGRLMLLRHFLQACEAVAYAHSQGVVHRDLKPDNILVGEFGETQVADWGLALRLNETVSRGRRAPPAPSSAPGTPGYMSPEQAASAPPDPRSDVFSLGVVLRQILSGEPPGRRGGPKSQALPQDAPRELAAICARAMAHSPAARYPDARALAADVERYLDGRRVAAHRYSALDELRRFLRAWRAPLSVGAAALVLLVCLGLWALRRTSQERDRALAAERQARSALAAADRSLQWVLVQKALAALKADEQPEAEVAAAGALRLGESPEARGVIAAFARARPRLLSQDPLPRCERLHLRPDGALLCVEGGEVVSLSGRPLRERWRRRLDAGDATWLSPGRVVMVEAGWHRGAVLSEDDGETRAGLPLLVGPAGFLEGEKVAVLLNPARVSLIDAGAAVRTVSPCGGIDRHLAAAVHVDTALVACWDGAIVFLGADGREVRRLRTDRGLTRPGISALAQTRDGGLVLFATLDGDVVALDARTGAERAVTHVSAGVIRRMVPAPDDERTALITDRGGVTLWHARTGAVLGRLPAGRSRTAAWASADELLVAGDDLRRWSLPPRLPAARILRAEPPGLAAADLSADGRRLAIASGDGAVAVLDTVTGARLFAHQLQATVIKGARFLPDGGVLAWSVGQPSLRRFTAAGTPLMTWGLPALRRAALLPSGWLVTVRYGRGAGLYPPPGPAVPAAPDRVLGGEMFFDADQDEGRGVVALLDKDGALWLVRDGDPPVGQEVLRRPGALSVAVAAGGALLAVAGEREGEVIDGRTGRTRCRFRGDGQRIQDLALSPDGRFVAAGDLDRAARIWSARDGRLLAVLRGHEERIASVSFAAGLLSTASWDGSARLWDLGVIERPAAALRTEIEAAWGLTLETAE